MKTFFNLIQEVQKQGRCNLCGGCATFCSAVNNGALGMDPDGWPYYRSVSECIECGLCYEICSQIHTLDPEIKKSVQWKEPSGKVFEISIARTRHAEARINAINGGVVTSLLIHLFETGWIDGAVMSKIFPNGRVSYLAKSGKDVLKGTGPPFNRNQGMFDLAGECADFLTSADELRDLKNSAMKRVAFVGVPCQINTIRKMQVLGLAPSDIIRYCFGMFCPGQYHFQKSFLQRLEQKHGFDVGRIQTVNINENVIISLSTGEKRLIRLDELDEANRLACDFCADYAAGYADLSFGGTGAPSGWTTVVTRTEIGASVLKPAMNSCLEPFRYEDDPKYISRAEEKIKAMSDFKRQRAEKSQKCLVRSGVRAIR